jgi:hypothetical protein
VLAANVRDDQRAVAEAKLRAVVLPNSHPLAEPERLGEPADGFSNVR